MIARSFRPVGWVAAVGAAALGCYMLSLRVAAERAELDRLDARIIAASRSIRELQTELGTRGRMQQLEAWNEEVLALSAPVSGQFVEGGVSLARFDVRQPQIAPDADVRLASAIVPRPQAPAAAAPMPQRTAAPAAPAPLVRRASAVIAPAPAAARPAPPPKAAPARSRPQAAAPAVRTASAETAIGPAATPTRTAAVAERARPAATPARTASAAERNRTARRSAALLDDRTISDLGSAARAERGGGTNN